ncbi:MAG: hypothetical protein GEV05_12410 [Betaproteobacteria bacterium]|nr:hypothetical protein [Betaproteobacteria bacterium]
MNAKELVVTILGLAGTFLLPWPGEPDRHGDPSERRGVVQASVCVHGCGEAVVMSRKEASSRAHPVDPKRLAQWRASR